MGGNAWLRFDSRALIFYAPTREILDQIGIDSTIARPCIHYGYRMWKAKTTADEFFDCVSRLAEIKQAKRSNAAAIAEARVCLLETFAYQAGASDQEHASHVMAVEGSNGYWNCRCGRVVPKDGIACICGATR